MMMAVFFVYLGDAMMSFWAPGLIDKSLGSGVLMGLVLGFSSIVGLLVDLFLPQIVQNVKVVKFYLLAGVAGTLFAVSMGIASISPFLLWFLSGMAAWGVFYELLLFANQQYVSDSVSGEQRSSVWAMLRAMSSLAYVIGPVSAGILLNTGSGSLVAAVIGLLVTGLLIVFVSLPKKHERRVVVETHHLSLKLEIKHWWDLMPRVWPILLMSLMIVLVDSAFWSVGAVLAERLAEESVWGGLWLSAHMAPSLVAGVLVARWGITKKKKRYAAKFLGFGGLTLMFLGAPIGLFLQVVVIFVAGMFLSLSIPLLDAVYTDLLVRMGKESKHLIGLTAAMGSFAYVVGPIVSGAMSDMVGERMVFVVMGMMAFILSIVLLLIMPKKLKLPQKEIHAWEK